LWRRTDDFYGGGSNMYRNIIALVSLVMVFMLQNKTAKRGREIKRERGRKREREEEGEGERGGGRGCMYVLVRERERP
jgi:hypothetical protein